MKVLHTIQGMSKASGGPSTCTYQLMQGLRQAGVDAQLLAFDSADNLADDNFIHYVANDCRTPLAISRNFNSYLRENVDNFDVIHSNGLWMWSGHQASRTAIESKKPLVISTHGMLYPQALRVSAWKKRIALPLFQSADLRNADVLHATCQDEYIHIRNFGLKNPVAVIPNCLPVPLKPRMRSVVNPVKRFGFVGRLNPIKNIDKLLEAWKGLGCATSDAELVIIGSGDAAYESSLRNFVEANSLKNVIFAGFLSGDVLDAAIQSLDYLVLPSKSENFGMVVPEALMRGVPVITSKGTPWKDVETEKCGWWVDSNAESLAAVISTALALPESERVEMGKRGIDFVVSRFSTETVAGQMKHLYQWLTGSGSKPDFVL